jgi:DNA-binding transcriptional MocR family regulator
MLKSVAWKSLDSTARALYIEIATRYGGPETNNGRIPYSVREAASALHVGKSTAARAFIQLQDRGFIVEMQKGAFSLKVRHATLWRLTEFGCDVTRELATREYARWSPPQNSKYDTCSGTARYPQRDGAVPVTGQRGSRPKLEIVTK